MSLIYQPGDNIADVSDSFSFYNDDEYENISNIHIKSFNESQDMNESRIPRKSGKFEIMNTQQIQKLHRKIANLKSENQFQLEEITNLKLKNADLSKFLTLEKLEMVRICEAKIEILNSENSPEIQEFQRSFEKKKMEIELCQKDEKIRKLEEKFENKAGIQKSAKIFGKSKKSKRIRSKSESQKEIVNSERKIQKMARLLEKKDQILARERRNWEEKERILMEKIEELKKELLEKK